MTDMTIIILTQDEEANIRRCIDSVKGLAKRIVVVDSGSTDKTIEIAQEMDILYCNLIMISLIFINQIMIILLFIKYMILKAKK